MALVNFKKGKESSIVSLGTSKKAKDGTLYVAEDSGKSYLGKSDGTLLQLKDDSTKYLPLTGGTLTGNLTLSGANLNANYVTGAWLQGTASNHIGSKQNAVAVFRNDGWLYSRTPEEIVKDGNGITSDDITWEEISPS